MTIVVKCDKVNCDKEDDLTAAELALLFKDNLGGWSCYGTDALCEDHQREFEQKSGKAS